ncbi:unnamed protein product [Euphydryas editha]|uniref:Tc1-like transposase DDE domain-containing protein n=1 Tax=Euphydryas editha TaxID=104508 RepID=A0AAU9UNB5_EUPED|nr:unnamed protein product [Euphydryas editha]
MEPEAGPSTGEASKCRRRRRHIIQPQDGSGSIPFTSPPAKRSKSILTSGERLMIINIFKYVTKTKPEDEYMSNHDLVKRTSEICGVNERSIYRVLSEYRDTHKITQPESTRKRPNVIQKVDDFDKSAIRRIVHSFFFFLKGEIPTLQKILHAVNNDETLPTLSKTSLRRIIRHLKFKYMKKSRKSVLIDRGDIVLWRVRYLHQIKKIREENRRISYTDETWVNAGHTVGKAWVDNTVKSAKRAFKEGLSTGAKDPVSKGKRLIVVHVGNEDGFLEDCEWVLTKLQRNDVIVLNNATYHSRRLEKTPTFAWKKDAIQNWLRAKNIPFDDDEVKRQLVEKVSNVKENFKSLVIDQIAEQKGVTVLRLPPYHCELNPIELIWADIKGYVARHNTTFKFTDLKKY